MVIVFAHIIFLVFQNRQMNCQVNKKSRFRHLLFAFNRGQKASEVAKDICAVYGEDAIGERTVRDWFTRFKHGNFDLNDAPRSGRSIKMDEDQLRDLLKEDGHQTCRELGEEMKCDFATISCHLQSMRFIQKLGAWVPHELTQKTRRISGYPLLLKILLNTMEQDILILGLGFSPGLTHSFLCFIFT